MHKWLKSRSMICRTCFWFSLTLGILGPGLATVHLRTSTRSYRYSNLADVPATRVAIVFGAGIWADGTPTPMLADRIEAAADLYQTGQVQKLLMTGDNGHKDYDEVTAMKRYAIGLGVAEADITLDYAGFSTYESCYRAKEIFGVSQAVLVTQKFHIARAVYTCRQLGIEAIGLGTPDWGRYSEASMRVNVLREALAGIKALGEIHLTRPKPTFLGPFEGI